MNVQKVVLVAVACIAVVSCMEVKFKDCGSKSGKPTHVYGEPCSSTPCILKRGTNSTIKVSFIPNTAITSVKAVCHAVMGGIPISLPIEGDDGCKESGLTCPLKEGVEVEYFKAIPILQEFPTMKFDVKWELLDEHSQDIVCVEYEVEVQ